jgi:hypothetical protein
MRTFLDILLVFICLMIVIEILINSGGALK